MSNKAEDYMNEVKRCFMKALNESEFGYYLQHAGLALRFVTIEQDGVMCIVPGFVLQEEVVKK